MASLAVSSSTTTSSSSASSAADASSSSSSSSKAKTPKDRHFERLEAVQEKYHAIGSTLERGVEKNNDDSSEDDDDDDDDDEGENLTEEQVAVLRHILITKRRDQYLEKLRKVVLGDQADDDILMFTTSFSYTIPDIVTKQIRAIAKHKTPAEKFDHLFALTKTLQTYDNWLHDYEDDEALRRHVVVPLGTAWKKLLAHTNEELEIDAEFTRPGVEAMLEKLAEDLREADPQFKLRWK
eukprot:TRINITY_DN1375_c0_g3_i1.p1 TRINITY_DN1375_c0_g3~~TRINITY_DN1375_c0_g3_i1.p1  ORF type:complete len:238 (+),score=82.04 TRINITY_DN1375_c0_g3_i1:82-795(+)